MGGGRNFNSGAEPPVLFAASGVRACGKKSANLLPELPLVKGDGVEEAHSLSPKEIRLILGLEQVEHLTLSMTGLLDLK